MRTVKLNKEDINKGYLILVNKENPINENIINNSMRLIPVDIEHKDILLEIKTATLLSQLLKTIESYDEIVPVSGYRDRAELEKIYNDSLLENGSVFTSQYVALPNRSEHQTGLSMDITSDSVNLQLTENFGDTDEGIWVAENAHRFGFIIRYPKDKEDITGYIYEPWHVRYVGEELAKKVYESGLTLEEYLFSE